ncbi:glycine zipper 2TM domain-containing protein [Janthinobacterium fluminis]|uniref:Glycine zipper 2TM domain-containing protein n=1 Tax=Janthinobacterium fluminis TaxID=2987524 RepID=A0ABT5JZE4_9BURK|nr:glycine zipper 2TM domain-containing protein [Janthinobacterium fluminis]MDC8758094.1 glycine zipper 2TM domain-containing protein [Janthinobacterium fluminis]
MKQASTTRFPGLARAALCAAFASLLAAAPLAAQAAPSQRGAHAAACQSCGTVISTRTYQQAAAHGSGVGAVGGAVVGGLLGNQIGGGNGRKLATVAGAVGGGFAGNAIEKQARSTTKTQVKVRMNNGSVRSFVEAGASRRHAGQYVKVVQGKLVAQR